MGLEHLSAYLARTKSASRLKAVCALVIALGTGCKLDETTESERPLRLATSYSLGDSGLFPVLERAFRDETKLAIKPWFVGSAAALTKARRGEADAVLVHERVMEDVFVGEGFGLNRRDIMHSDLLLVGPKSDPAAVRGLISAVEAFAVLAAKRAPFVSRGDGSGTHVRERALWQLAGVSPEGSWYSETRGGMLATLQQASQQGAYALVDRPSYLVSRKDLALEILVAGDSRLHNAYGVMAVNPLKVEGANYEAAILFIDFLVSPKAVAIIRDYGREQFGEPLFFPASEGG